MRSAFLSYSLRALGLVLLVALVGCAGEERPQSTGEADTLNSDTTTSRTVADDSVIQGTGTIRYVDLEGGFYGLVDEEGTKYDPTPLPESLRIDGLSIRFRVREKDVMTSRMWGTPVELLSAERIGDEND